MSLIFVFPNHILADRMVNDRIWHYGNFKLQYSFLPYLTKRELVLLPAKNKNRAVPIRNLRVNNTQNFQFILDRLSAFQNGRDYNIYYSMATFKEGIPYQDLTNLSSDARDNKKWNDDAHRHIVAYDMPLDIDAGSHEELDFAFDSMHNILKILNRAGTPFYLKFSGMGFHFVIPYRAFPATLHFDPFKEGNIYDIMRDISVRLHEEFSEMIDTNIYDCRRILKIPNSLSIYEDGDYICAPLDILRGFSLDYFRMGKSYKSLSLGADTLHNPLGNIYNLCFQLGIKVEDYG